MSIDIIKRLDEETGRIDAAHKTKNNCEKVPKIAFRVKYARLRAFPGFDEIDEGPYAENFITVFLVSLGLHFLLIGLFVLSSEELSLLLVGRVHLEDPPELRIWDEIQRVDVSQLKVTS